MAKKFSRRAVLDILYDHYQLQRVYSDDAFKQGDHEIGKQFAAKAATTFVLYQKIVALEVEE